MSMPLHSGLPDIIDARSLRTVFQPVFDVRRCRFIGYEGLIRGPGGTAIEAPLDLFRYARETGQAARVEHDARQRLLADFTSQRLQGMLFLNGSADLLFDDPDADDALEHETVSDRFGLHPSRIVLEITELERAHYGKHFMRALGRFRKLGYRFAIDDLGEGFSNARLWNELRPDIVKIDRHLIAGIDRDPFKRKFVKAIQGLAEDFGVMLIAEGIETPEELRMVRDLRVQAAQGFFIARPEAEPATAPSDLVVEELDRRKVTMPAAVSPRARQPAIATIMDFVEPATPATSNNEVFSRFEAESELELLPVTDDRGRALGLIHRYHFLDSFARPYRRELYGRKSCQAFMEAASLEVDATATIQDTVLQLSRSSGEQRLSGVLVVDAQRYVGLVTVQQLMAAITESQVAAARYANPLTELPGNVPINEQIDHMIATGVSFIASYVDIDHFKPFNDHYGYSDGDDLILQLAELLARHCDRQQDFVGHVGGDDFFLLLQSENWRERLDGLFEPFDRGLRSLCSSKDLAAEGFHGRNRRGERVVHPLPTLSIGVITVRPGEFESHRELSDWLARAKSMAKRENGHSLFIERRSPDRPPAP